MLKNLKKNQRMLTVLLVLELYVLVQYIFLPHGLDPEKVLFNYLLVLPFFGFLLLVTQKNYLAFAIISILLYIFSFIDGIVYAGRLTHIRYSDLFALADALRVADKYSIPFTKQNAIHLVIIVLASLIAIFTSVNLREKQRRKENALVGAVILVLSLGYWIIGTKASFIPNPLVSVDDNFDINGMVDRDGLYYSLYGQYSNSKIKAPSGYEAGKAVDILAKYHEEAGNDEPIRVIVVMNEALSDYSLLGKPMFGDSLRNIHNPQNGYFEGKLAVSVFGGYTCNTEFEFLTGCSMRFFPAEYIPFSQLISTEMPSLAWELKAGGFRADGIHPYYSQEWNRRHVYKCLGFDRFIAGEDFSSGLANSADIHNITDTHLKQLDFGVNLEYIRGFVSDMEAYRKTCDMLSGESGNHFIFLVTMQNHGGYEYTGKDFVNTEYIENEYALNQYLTCSAISDTAFQMFIEKLAEDDKKTIVLMFGDHQPGLDFSHYVEGYLENPFAAYYVPYLVWSNFELEDKLPKVISVNYLSAVLKKCAGLPLTQWDQLRLETMRHYPVITAHCVIDSTMNNVPEAMMDSGLLRDYAIVQYDRIKRGANG